MSYLAYSNIQQYFYIEMRSPKISSTLNMKKLNLCHMSSLFWSLLFFVAFFLHTNINKAPKKYLARGHVTSFSSVYTIIIC